MKNVRKIDYEKQSIADKVNEWKLDSNIMMVNADYPSFNKLKEDYIEFLNMPQNLQDDSDEVSIRLFGKTNKERYNEMRNKFFNKPEIDSVFFRHTPYILYKSSPVTEMKDMILFNSGKLKTSPIMESSDISLDLYKGVLRSKIESYNMSDDHFIMFPMYTGEEIDSLKESYDGSPLYSNKVYNENDEKVSYTLPTKWRESYNGLYKGLIDNYGEKEYVFWKNRIKSLYEKMNDTTDKDEINTIQQSILSYGWNPMVYPSEENMVKASLRNKKLIHKLMNDYQIINIQSNSDDVDLTKSINPSSTVCNSLHELYIVCTKDKYKTDLYTNLYITSDPKLNNLLKISLYSDGKHFDVENVYNMNKDTEVDVYILYTSIDVYQYFLQYKKNNSDIAMYGKRQSFSVSSNNKGYFKLMVRSIIKPNKNIQFTSNIFLAYSGKIKNCNLFVQEELLSMVESLLYEEQSFSYNEAVLTNQLPVEFNKDGDLLISKGKNIDYEGEFSRAHLALRLYEHNKNIVGMKYSVCKLWYLNINIEEKLHSKKKTLNKEEKQDLNKARAKILSDISKYSIIILKTEPDFDIVKEFQNSPFNNDKISISRTTMNYMYDTIKKISKLKLF